MSTVISVENISKRYVIGHQRAKGDGMRDILEDAVRSPLKWFKSRGERQKRTREEFWALKDVSFEIKQGEVAGIIGRNGAGKSTLLKILSRITEPTAGRIRIKGRVASLLEVGTGFHPDLTGRENIFLNGAILGMSREEIKRKFDEIVDFSEIEKFLDTPVKRYSSGMYVRLAFAVAAHLEPEILIVDEVLAVGDAQFQKKCLGKMKDVSQGGRTVLFVSHNMSAILNLCTKALYLEGGKLTRSGEADSIVRYYLQRALPSIINGKPLSQRTDRTGNSNIKIVSCRIEDDNGRQVHEAVSGMDISLVLGYETKAGKSFQRVDPGISIHTETGETIFVHYCSYNRGLLEAKGPKGEFRFKLEHLPLSPGRYIIGSRITVNGEEADWPRDGIAFMTVEAGDFYGTGSKGCEGVTAILIDGTWTS
jgi:lipopolysaccharide transport system ATP-binding protein